MKYLVLYLLHNVLLQTAESIKLRRKWSRWNETNVTFGETIDLIESISLMMCLAKCQETSRCVAAHVHEASLKWELSAYYPLDGTKSATPRIRWTVYFKDLYEVQGVQAWQTSTYADCAAENAIDGKLDEKVCPTVFPCDCRCAHTNSPNSAWVMELKTPGYVKAVDLYFRVGSAQDLWRNGNFLIMVYDSFEDAKKGIMDGAFRICTGYFKEPITSVIRMSCLSATYGKTVGIYKKNSGVVIDDIQLREVKVFFI